MRSSSKPPKSELARPYVTDTAQVKANLPGAIASRSAGLLAALRKQHDMFNALLQINLTVLATAHAVSEGLIRGAHSRGRPQERAADLWQFRAARRSAQERGHAGVGQPLALGASEYFGGISARFFKTLLTRRSS